FRRGLRPIDPVGGATAAYVDLVSLDRDAAEPSCIGRRHGHELSLRASLRRDVGCHPYRGVMAIDLELPTWLGRIGVFDLETTGVDVAADRIVTAYVGVLDAKGREVAARSWIADPGVPIPDGAAAVHGITTEHARAHGRPAHEVVTEVAASLRALFAQGLPVVAYNASYDFSLLTHESIRHGVAILEE